METKASEVRGTKLKQKNRIAARGLHLLGSASDLKENRRNFTVGPVLSGSTEREREGQGLKEDMLATTHQAPWTARKADTAARQLPDA